MDLEYQLKDTKCILRPAHAMRFYYYDETKEMNLKKVMYK